MKTRFENIDIWQCHDALYCKRSDGHLVKIQSSDLSKVLQVLQFVKQGKTLPNFQDDNLSQEEISEIVKFLLQNQIIRQEYSNTEAHICHKQVGVFCAEDTFNLLALVLQPEGYQLHFKKVEKPDDLKDIQLLLVISPVFEHYRCLEDLSNACYRQQIPLLYSEFSPTSFNIGPLVEPRLHTPSLSCYMKRKKVNLNNLELYSEFIQSESKQRINQVKVTDYPYFFIGIELLKVELGFYWKYEGQLSTRLMGKAIVLDFIQYRSEHSLVLKDPSSPLFSKTPFVPFNG